MRGDRWKAGDGIMFFIYTPVFTVGLASKENRPKLLAILPPPLPFGAVSFFYLNYVFPRPSLFLHIFLTLKTYTFIHSHKTSPSDGST